MYKCCICGSGDISKALITKMQHIDNIEIYWFSKNNILQKLFTIDYLDKKIKINNYKIVDNSKLDTYFFDSMIFTYPHMYYKENYEYLFFMNKNITHSIFFMFCFGSAMENIYDFINKYPKIGVIIGNRAFFHAKTKNSITCVTKDCSTECVVFDNNIYCLVMLSIFRHNNLFDIRIIKNPIKIFINTSNMLLHPSLWIEKFKYNDIKDDQYIYRNVGSSAVIMYKNMRLEVYELIKNITKDREDFHFEIIFGVSPNFFLDIISKYIFESTMPTHYLGNKKVKYKHYERDVIHGLVYIQSISKIYNINLETINKVIDIYDSLVFFKESKYYNKDNRPVCTDKKIIEFYLSKTDLYDNYVYINIPKALKISNFPPIYIIRHSVGEHQLQNSLIKLIKNNYDPLLTPDGIQKCFNNNTIKISKNTLLISFPLKRCLMTAKLLCMKNNVDITININSYFRERSHFILPEDKLNQENISPSIFMEKISYNMINCIVYNYIVKNNYFNYDKCIIVSHKNFIGHCDNLDIFQIY